METIPAELASDDAQLAALFEQYFPGSVHSYVQAGSPLASSCCWRSHPLAHTHLWSRVASPRAHMVRLSHALDVLLDERDAAIIRFQEADCRHVATGVRPTKRTSCCGGRVDVIDACEAELVRLHADIVKEREELGHSRAGSCGFVTFNNHRAAALAIMGRIVDDPVNVATSRAPEARDLIWCVPTSLCMWRGNTYRVHELTHAHPPYAGNICQLVRACDRCAHPSATHSALLCLLPTLFQCSGSSSWPSGNTLLGGATGYPV